MLTRKVEKARIAINFRLPERLYWWLYYEAERRGVSMNTAVLDLLEAATAGAKVKV